VYQPRPIQEAGQLTFPNRWSVLRCNSQGLNAQTQYRKFTKFLLTVYVDNNFSAYTCPKLFVSGGGTPAYRLMSARVRHTSKWFTGHHWGYHHHTQSVSIKCRQITRAVIIYIDCDWRLLFGFLVLSWRCKSQVTLTTKSSAGVPALPRCTGVVWEANMLPSYEMLLELTTLPSKRKDIPTDKVYTSFTHRIHVVRCPVSCVLNLSIDLNSLTLAKSNWHVHKN
jgi:hypothetical protein